LRRASILETRKARLADRAAHVEQVRLRAAQAKAAPRTSNSEEKALAAQQAREQHLAKVVAACAEEVARAKKIAEEMKEKKATEERKCKMELEEKHADAERRRQDYRRTVRARGSGTGSSSSLVPDEKKAVEILRSDFVDEIAVRRIQNAWRISRRRGIVRNFLALDLSVARLKALDFAAASAFLARADLIHHTTRLMNLLELDTGSDTSTVTTRRFLSAFIVLGKTEEIIGNQGVSEYGLIEKAGALVRSIEVTIPAIAASAACAPTWKQSAELSHLLATFLTVFSAWKSKDASSLIETMVEQFVAFDAIWQTVKDDSRGEVASDYRDGIRKQQVMLLSSLNKLAGKERAGVLIKKAIRESKRAAHARAMLVDRRPRPAEVECTVVDMQPGSDTVMQAASKTLAASSQTEVLARLFSPIPDNRRLVHELALNPVYRVEPEEENGRLQLNRMICENMARGVLNGQGEIWTVALAVNIRSRLSGLVKQGSAMGKTIDDVLDAQHIQNQCRQGIFSYQHFFVFMADLIPQLCAPYRDAQFGAFLQTLHSHHNDTTTMIERLLGILQMIDQLVLDNFNYTLQQAASTLIAEAPGYEQRMFAQDLQAGVSSLDQIKGCLMSATSRLISESGYLEAPSITPDFSKIYTRMLVDLVMPPSCSINDVDIPEPLRLSSRRLARLGLRMLRTATAGTILLTAKNLLRRDVRTPWRNEARRVLDLLSQEGGSSGNGSGGNDPAVPISPGLDSALPQAAAQAAAAAAAAAAAEAPFRAIAPRVLAVLESAHPMPPASRSQLAACVDRTVASLHAGRAGDPVTKLLLHRARLHAWRRLAAATPIERERAAGAASIALANVGLVEALAEVNEVVAELDCVASVDQAAHGVWYERLAGELAGGGAATD